MNWNHLGVEIRKRTVDEAMLRIAKDENKNLNDNNTSVTNKNLYFLTCNFSASLKELLNKFPRQGNKLFYTDEKSLK